jgi:hypothetical protein
MRRSQEPKGNRLKCSREGLEGVKPQIRNKKGILLQQKEMVTVQFFGLGQLFLGHYILYDWATFGTGAGGVNCHRCRMISFFFRG